jgi:Ataxin-3
LTYCCTKLTHAYVSSSKDYIRRVQEGSGNVDAAGNFSIQVLRAALERMFELALPSIGQEDLESSKRDITTYEGFICNRSDHWFAIRKIGPQFWNLNSMLERPEPISHFRLAAELESYKANGYSVFVVTQPLPLADRSTGSPKHWWRRADLEGKVRGSGSGTKASTDWSVVGTGRRLDGQSQSSARPHEYMTEDEMLQHALQASILPDIPDEPLADDPNAVTIQFRFGDGKRQVRRFNRDQPVMVVYAFCEREIGGGAVDLRFGFPPKDLSECKQKSVGEANLHGESIQARNA